MSAITCIVTVVAIVINHLVVGIVNAIVIIDLIYTRAYAYS